jgi:hypothetical protein
MKYNLSKTEFVPEDAAALKALYDKLIQAVGYVEFEQTYKYSKDDICTQLEPMELADLVVDARVAISELLDI